MLKACVGGELVDTGETIVEVLCNFDFFSFVKMAPVEYLLEVFKLSIVGVLVGAFLRDTEKS